MIRLLLFALTLFSFHAAACRVSYQLPSDVIEFDYLYGVGTYSVRVPLILGKGDLVSVELSYRKEGGIEPKTRRLSVPIDGKAVDEIWVGTFTARSKKGYEAWVIASWNTKICPTFSEKKVELFPLDV